MTQRRDADYEGWWAVRHERLCAEFPELQATPVEAWPTDLAGTVETIFADSSLAESEQLAKAEREVLSRYMQRLQIASTVVPQDLENCLLAAVRRHVQDAFEEWKVGASVG